MIRQRPILLALLVGLAAPACGSRVQRHEAPTLVSVADLPPDQRAARSTNDFNHALLEQLGEGNLALSPVSISTAVAMAYAGARGATATELADVMASPPDAVVGFGALHQALEGRDVEGAGDTGVTLSLANDVWVQQGFELLPDYLTTLQEHYGAGPRELDFKEAHEESTEKINEQVSEATQAKIPELIPQGIVTPLTRVVLTNAMYLKATWAFPFEEEATSPDTFHTPDGEVSAPTMHQVAGFRRAEGDGFEALELPYVGGELAALVVLPERGRLDEVQASFDAAAFASTLAGLRSARVDVRMPRFRVRQNHSLVKELRAMGASAPFSDMADFSGITREAPLKISEVIHEAYIDVDESGTEAAAATAVILVEISSARPQAPTPFHVDRPFLFYVYDRPTGAILFVARVVDPTA